MDFATPEKTLAESALLSSYEGKANMVPFFCKTYVEKTGHNVVAVHAAKGSTEIDVWQRGMYAYDMMCKKARAAIEKVKPDRVLFVWLQGESDAIAGRSKAYYREKLEALNQSVKEDLGVEKFCMIQVDRYVGNESDLEIIRAQQEACAENPDFLMLTDFTWEMTEDPQYMNPFVVGHFGCYGFEVLGTKAAAPLADYVLSHPVQKA